MRQLNRERQSVWVSNFVSKTQITDTEGRLTGNWTITHSAPKKLFPTLSPCSGNTFMDGFGMGDSYDRTMIIDDVDTGLTEASVVWVDVEPLLDDAGEIVLDNNFEPVVPWDYEVSRVAVSYNYTNVALKKVD